MPNMVADLLQPLRRIGDMRGRSTRSELARWLVLAMALTVATDLASAASGARNQAQLAASLLLLAPTIPLAIRRVHDVGWSGWWLILSLPIVAMNLLILAGRSGLQTFDPAASPTELLPLMIGLLVGNVALLFWKGRPGPNRFGPDPRA